MVSPSKKGKEGTSDCALPERAERVLSRPPEKKSEDPCQPSKHKYSLSPGIGTKGEGLTGLVAARLTLLCELGN